MDLFRDILLSLLLAAGLTAFVGMVIPPIILGLPIALFGLFMLFDPGCAHGVGFGLFLGAGIVSLLMRAPTFGESIAAILGAIIGWKIGSS